MRAWLSVSVSAGLGLLVFACATGNTSSPPGVDSGPPTGSGDCVGQNSAQLGGTYDAACDAYYFNVGASHPCTPGGNACAALDTSTLKFCCYKPLPGLYCDEDYFGTPQCLPK